MLNRLASKVPFLVGLACVGIFYYPILGQKFWMLDDHNFVYWYLQEDGTRIQRFLNFLGETNFGDFPNGLRFAPTLSILFAARTAFLPSDPIYWFAINYILVLATFTVIYLTIKNFLRTNESQKFCAGNILISLVAVFGLCNSVGARVFSRLGTGEVYALFFLSLTMYFLQKIVKESNIGKNWIWLLISQSLLIGCKENYIWINVFVTIVVGVVVRNENELTRKYKTLFIALRSLVGQFKKNW